MTLLPPDFGDVSDAHAALVARWPHFRWYPTTDVPPNGRYFVDPDTAALWLPRPFGGDAAFAAFLDAASELLCGPATADVLPLHRWPRPARCRRD